MGKIAFMFSGQGAQHPGMGQAFYESNENVKALYDSAESIREGTIAQSFTSDLETLTLTQNAQPCLYLADLSAAIALRDAGIEPDALAGFSLGEIPALAFGGAFSYEDGFKITCERGKAMGKASAKYDTGMVAVVKSDNATVESICEKYEHVYPVNYNCSAQLVCAGLKDELESFCADVKASGARAIPLKVSGAFHSPFMAKAAVELGEFIKGIDIEEPDIPVYSNFTTQPYSGDLKHLIENQINHPVKWEAIIQNLIAQGTDTFIEVGVGNTLMKLIGKIAKDVTAYKAENPDDVAAIKEALQNA